MTRAAQILWLIPILPLLAAAITALLKQSQRKVAASLAIGSMSAALGLAVLALASAASRQWVNFRWFQIGENWLHLGWVLDPLTAVMLVMVCFVGLLIFIYSTGYMAHDQNFTRFFCFLSLFATAMLGLVIANSLLLLFICWELVGLTSYLLIGFWYSKPSAAAAAKKAFITTRIGDLALFLGMIWLYFETGTLLFYDSGSGCLEANSLARLLAHPPVFGLGLVTPIALLIFLGAVGKSGQVPLHVWLPDAMEGPTPVSALIHAATMVAAGVFLVARVYPLMEAHPEGTNAHALALQVITWTGAITALFAATIAVAQTDIKRVLAYSTVSQLGFMMMGLGAGGVAVGIFHLITHAFFKALLFMGAGSVIHGMREEQDIRRMGGLRRFMPVTFATYAVGMMALSGVPLLFSGFWSKDEILHATHSWPISYGPFYLGLVSALLTAFYMTRQICFVFFGKPAVSHGPKHGKHKMPVPHESPRVMTTPLVILAVCSVLLGFIGTPAWPWIQAFLEGEHATVNFSNLFAATTLKTMALSAFIAATGIFLGYWFYGRHSLPSTDEPDPLERLQPAWFNVLRQKFYIDELYAVSFVRVCAGWSTFCDWLDRKLWGGAVELVSLVTVGLSWINRLFDEYAINLGFDQACRSLTRAGRTLARVQDGRVQKYMRAIGAGLVVLVFILLWGCRAL